MGKKISDQTDDNRLYGELMNRFGYREFRPEQKAVIRDIIAGGIRLTVFATGGGKSLCYLLPAGLLTGKTVVVSPLIALMEDQARRAAAAGYRAVLWRGSVTAQSLAAAELILLSPEKLADPCVAGRLKQLGVAHLVIDEAHCVFSWGGSFRPAYAQLAYWVEMLDCGRVSLFTATAAPEVRRRLIEQFGVERVFESGADRPNLFWHCRRSEDPMLEAALLSAKISGKVVIYCSSRQQAEETALFLQRCGHAAACFHAGMVPELRARVMHRYRYGPLRILCATAAFGMGVDLPDIRAVIHLAPPGGIAAYQQEAGRAGRDGEGALALLLYRSIPHRSRQKDGLRAVDLASGSAPETEWLGLLTDRFGRSGGAVVWAQLLDSGAVSLSGSEEVVAVPGGSPAWMVRTVRRKKNRDGRFRRKEIRRYLKAQHCRRKKMLQLGGNRLEGRCNGCDRCGSPYTQLVEENRRETKRIAGVLNRHQTGRLKKKPPEEAVGGRLWDALLRRRF